MGKIDALSGWAFLAKGGTMRRRSSIRLMACLFIGLLGCTKKVVDSRPIIPIEIKTSLGMIQLELYRDKAPQTVNNFLRYVDSGHYRGTVFHRVIPGFVIQGGGFTADLKQKSTDPPIKNEANNGLSNQVGTIAMARTGVIDSATSQFYINVGDNVSLDFREPTTSGHGYAVFGKVTGGMEVVQAIASIKTGARGPFPGDVPLEPITIEDVAVR